MLSTHRQVRGFLKKFGHLCTEKRRIDYSDKKKVSVCEVQHGFLNHQYEMFIQGFHI